MGSEVEEILQFFALSEEQKDDYSMVLNHFEHHLVKKKNAIYERAKFNGEEVDFHHSTVWSREHLCVSMGHSLVRQTFEGGRECLVTIASNPWTIGVVGMFIIKISTRKINSSRMRQM